MKKWFSIVVLVAIVGVLLFKTAPRSTFSYTNRTLGDPNVLQRQMAMAHLGNSRNAVVFTSENGKPVMFSRNGIGVAPAQVNSMPGK